MAGLKFTMTTRGFDSIGRRMTKISPQAAHALANVMAADTRKYVPALTESLNNRTHVDGDTIIYPGPYARFLYYGKLMIDPNTGSAWAPEGATKVVTGTNLQFSKSPHSKAQSHWFEASKAQNLGKWKQVARSAMRREFGG